MTEPKPNVISGLVGKYQSTVTSPAMQAALLAGAGIPLAYLLKRPVFKGLKSLARDRRVATALGLSTRDAQQGVEQMQNHWVGRHALPLTLGILPAVASLAVTAKPNMPGFGWDTWRHRMTKQQSIKKLASLWQAQGYQPQIDFSQQLNPNTVIDMLNSNPYMQASPMQRLRGVSIMAAAPKVGQQTTLGGVYDSANNKFDAKLNRSGVTDKAVKSLVSGALAGMFTDTIGAVMGMPDPLRGQIATSAAFGKALYSILS